MTDRELVDALRNTTSRSKRKLLNAAADRIEAAVDFETATNGEMIGGIPLQDYRNTYAITRGGVLNPEVLHELRRMHEQQLAAEDRLKHNRRVLKRLLMQFMADLKKKKTGRHRKMSRKNNLVAVIEREVHRRLEQYTAVRMRMAADAALMAANDVFQCGPGRANEFVGKFIDYCNWIAEIFVEDSKDDPELVYAKAVLDRRIKAIMGDEHFRPYETRYYYERTGGGE